MATLKEVAEGAGVSLSTASRVFSGTTFVEESTKNRVLKAAKELNYYPNALGRSLKKKQTRNIGILIPDIRNPIFPILVRAMEDKAEKEGYTICLCNTDENATKEERYMRVLQSLWVDGIVVATGGLCSQWADIEGFFGRKVPVVSVIRKVNDSVDLIASDHKGAMNQALDYLLQSGRKKIAICVGTQNVMAYEERFQTYKERMTSLGLYKESRILHIVPYDNVSGKEDDSYSRMKSYLDSGVETDAIIAANDISAMQCLRALTEKGLKVPEEVAVIGFDNVDISSMVNPPLTTVAQPFYEMGEKAIELLIRKIEEKNTAEMVQTIRFANHLILRQTT